MQQDSEGTDDADAPPHDALRVKAGWVNSPFGWDSLAGVPERSPARALIRVQRAPCCV